MATGRHRHYDLRDEDDVAQLDADYRRVLHGCRPDKLEVQDRHIQRHKDSAHVDRITSAYRKIDGYSRFDSTAGVPVHNTARLVLEFSPKQMLSSLGEDIDRTNWAGWTCLHMAAWYGSLPHVEALLDAAPRAASALRPSARDFTLAAGCTAVDVAKCAIRKFVHRPSTISTASQGWADREAILWRLNEAAMVEWVALVSPNAATAYRQAFTAAVRALWLALGGKHLGPPIRRESYKGSSALSFDGSVRLLGGGERVKKISLPDCYRIWAESAATEAQGHLLGGQLRGLLYAMIPPCGKLWVYARTADAVTEISLREVFGAFAEDAAALKIVSLGLLAHDDPVNGTGSAAPADSHQAVAQAADGSSTRPLGWDCCAFLEFASYAEAARAYEAQRGAVSVVTENSNERPLYLVEWSRLGPLRLPPMPRTAALSRHFGVMPQDYHFTSIGL